MTKKQPPKPTKRIVAAINDEKNRIKAVRFEGNKTFTPLDKAIEMADKGMIERTHVVRRENARTHIRTNADGVQKNNLDDIAGS